MCYYVVAEGGYIMAQTSLNIRMDEDLKKDFDYVCSELGINMSTAITIFAKKMSREHRIPFDVSLDSFYSESNVKALKESIKQISNGNVVIKTMKELEEMENA